MFIKKFTISFASLLVGILIGFTISNLNLHKTTEQKYEFKLSNSQALLNNNCNYTSSGPRILCTILSTPKESDLIKALLDTWVKRCDKYIFVFGAHNFQLAQKENFIFLNLTQETKEKLTEKIIKTILYIYEHYLDEFDWFLKADLDTFIIIENLKNFLFDKCSNHKNSYGRQFKKFYKHGYLDGGSGYVLSKEAIRLFGDAMKQSDGKFCEAKTGIEDVELAGCLDRLGIVPGDSTDEFGRERFHFTNLTSIWNYKEPWIFDYSKQVKHGRECCSDSSIGFHRIKGVDMYQFEYLVYNLKIKNIIN